MSKSRTVVMSVLAFSVLAIATSGILPTAGSPRSLDYDPATIWGETDLGGVQSSLNGYLSSSLLEPWSGKEVRVVVLAHAFVQEGRVLGRALLHRVIDESNAQEAITATMSINPDPGGPTTGALPVYSIRIAPAPGETWKSVSTYEHLVVTGGRAD